MLKGVLHKAERREWLGMKGSEKAWFLRDPFRTTTQMLAMKHDNIETHVGNL